jgi:hypothetical protein
MMASFSLQCAWGQSDNPGAKYITDKEKEWTQSACTHQPVAQKFLADDFQGTAPNGERYDKAKALDRDRSLTARDCRLDEATVRFFGEQVAVVYGKDRATIKVQGGTERTRCLVWTHVWIDRNRKWEIVSAQDSALPCP